MTTVIINENKSVEIKGIRAKELGILMNHYSKLRKRASENEDVAMALSGLTYLFKEGEKEKNILGLLVPQILTTFYDELLELMTEILPLTKEEVDEMDLDVLVEIVGTYIQETDLEKVIKLAAKLATQFR